MNVTDRKIRSARRAPRALFAVALAATLAACGRDYHDAYALTGGNPERGKAVMRQYGCGACHTIPGLRGATAIVGPDLDGIGSRAYIAGVVPNTPGNMIRWVQNPQQVDDKTAMPYLGVRPNDARDIAAYLYTLK